MSAGAVSETPTPARLIVIAAFGLVLFLVCIGKLFFYDLRALDTPYRKLPQKAKQVLLYGSGEEEITFWYEKGARRYEFPRAFDGVIPSLERRLSLDVLAHVSQVLRGKRKGLHQPRKMAAPQLSARMIVGPRAALRAGIPSDRLPEKFVSA